LLAATDAGAVAVLVPETPIAAPQYAGVSGSLATTPGFACNADGCLAAWRDGRQFLGYRIWARRLRTDGTPRDAAAFLISVDNFDATDPVVATDGTRFLVGWTDLFEKAYLTRVDADDSLHTESLSVADGYTGLVNPSALASNGDGYLFALGYTVGAPGGTIRGLRTDRDGHILDATPFLITDDPTARFYADVVWTGTQYLVVWNQGQGDDADAYGARVLADGTVMDPSGFFVATLSGFSNWPRLAAGGGKLLLASGRSSGSSGGGVTAFLLDADGRNGHAVSLPSVASSGTYATAAWNGSTFVVNWIGSLGPVAVRVAPDGTVMDSAPLSIGFAGQSETPASAVSGGTTFVVFIDRTYNGVPVRVASLSAAGVPNFASDPPLDVGAAPQRLLATARGAGHTLIVWADDTQGKYASALLAARVSDDGVVLDAPPIVLSAAAPNKQGASAAAAWAGGQYLVSWWEQTGPAMDHFQVARISGAGELRDTTPTVLDSNLFFGQYTEVAADGDKFLVAWSPQGIISTPPAINAVIIGADGKPSGARFTLGTAGEASYPWAVAAAEGGGYLAAWNRFIPGSYGVQVESIDSAGVQGSPVRVTEDQAVGSLALVPSAGRTLVWMNGQIGLLVSPAPSFTALPGAARFDAKRDIGAPSWNGAVYVGASVTTRGIYDYDSVGVDVSVLSADGVLSDPPTTIVPPRLATTEPPVVIGLGPDRNLVVYSRLVPEHDYGALRVRFQIVDSGRSVTTTDGGTMNDGAVIIDSGPAVDAGGAGDAVVVIDAGQADAVDAGRARDASADGLVDAQDATPETGHPDSATADADDDAIADASAPDLARSDATADAVATPDAVADAREMDGGRPDVETAVDATAPHDAGAASDATASRDAGADAGTGSSSGCSCAMSSSGGGLGAPAILVFAFVACVRRRHRRRDR
jgi:hypothetical protein